MFNKITEVFSKKMVFFNAKFYAVDVPKGFNSPDDKGTLYVNARGEKTPLFVLGHEMLHSLRLDSSGRYNRLSKIFKVIQIVNVNVDCIDYRYTFSRFLQGELRVRKDETAGHIIHG